MISRNFYTILIPKELGICTVCKLQEFPVTQILREIKVDESRVSEFATWAVLELLDSPKWSSRKI